MKKLTNLEKYLNQVRYIQEMDDMWSKERASEEHELRRELASKLTPEEREEARKILGWKI